MHRVVYNQGAQTLYHIPVDARGWPTRVSSATYTIEDMREGLTSSGREIVAPGATTLDSIDTTTTAAAGPSSGQERRLTLTDVTGITEGRPYLLSENDGGRRELVHVTEIDSGNSYVYLAHPIMGEYSSGALFQGIRHSGSFPAAEANDEDETVEKSGGPYQVKWTYTIDDRVHVIGEPIVVDRYSTPTSWISPDEIARERPANLRLISQSDLAALVAIATKEVIGELEAAHIPPARYRHTSAGEIAVKYLALEHMYRRFGGDMFSEMADTYRERYKVQIHQMTHGEPPLGATSLSLADDVPSKALDPTGIFSRP